MAALCFTFPLVMLMLNDASAEDGPEVVDYCSQTLQDASVCLGYVTTNATQDPIMATISGAFTAGNLDAAYTFYLGAAQSLDAAQNSIVLSAFELATTDYDQAAALLGGASGLALPSSSAVTNVGIDQGSSTTAPQAKNGHCCAYQATDWEWSGKIINYGYCSNTPYGTYCESLGHFYSEVHSNVTFSPSVTWYHYFSHKSGHQAYLNNVTVKMKRDITGKADPSVGSYGCSSGWVPQGCEQSRESPHVQGNYYYVELNADVTCKCGKPSPHLQVQTRRWYIPAFGYTYYPAFFDGG